jgi:tRNA(fMet)-specific endonuclease VapC
MDYLLDSDIIIDFLKKKNIGISAIQKIAEKEIGISVVSWLEIVYGINKSSNPQKRRLEFEQFLSTFHITVIPIDIVVAQRFIKLKIDLENKKSVLADFDLPMNQKAMG